MSADPRSARDAATHIGRVGVLAVALGIGAAMATGTGVAWAEEPDVGSTGRNSEQSASADSSSASAGPTRRSHRTAIRGTQRGKVAAAPTRDALPESALPAEAAPVESTARAAGTERPAASRNNGPADLPDRAPSLGLNIPEPQQVFQSGPLASVAKSDALPDATPAPAAATAPTPRSGLISAVPQIVSTVAGDPVPDVPLSVVPVSKTPLSTFPGSPVVAAPQAAKTAKAPTLTAPRLVSRLLSAFGLGPVAGSSTPGAPMDSPALWALLGWARRDMGRTGVRTAAAQSALPSATVAAAVVSTPTNLPSTPLGWVTGQRNTAFPGLTWPQTNNTRWANIYGTDLGIMWFNGENGLTQLAFGDTFSGPNMTGDWRSNVLLLSDDTNLTDGLGLINTGPAFQFIPAARDQVFFIGSEVTNIPTSAIYANNNNYVNYMSVKSWDSPGRWTTNYSAISQYNPVTDRWVLQRQTVRPAGYFRSSTMYRAGDQNFQQMAYVLQAESKVVDGEPRYVYAFGTPAGRAGSAYLSRVPENAVTDLKQYQYWNGSTWVTNQAQATAVIGDSNKSAGLFGWAIDIANDPNVLGGALAGFTGAKTGGNVSEMSVQYNEYLDKYVVLYGNGANNVILRTADSPEGPWSDPITIATSVQYPGLYAPMIHPLSGTGQLTDSGGDPDISNLYWNMSLWGNYNVVLMQTDLAPLAVTPV